MSKKLNVAVIGLGVGSRHADFYYESKHCNLKTLCDFDLKILNHVSKKYKNIALTNDTKDIFNDKSIDLVSIASYDNYHYEQIISCFKSKKHFFVEKPMCLNENQLKKIKKYYDFHKGEIKFSSNFVLRGNNAFKDIKKNLLKKIDENIYFIEGEYNYGRIEKITKGWRSDQLNYSINLGGSTHLVDLLLWINNSKVLKVVSSGNNISTKDSRFKNYDFSTSILEFENGVTGKITANFGCVTPHHHSLSVYTTKRTIKHNLENSIIYKSRLNNEYPKKFNIKKGYDKSLILNSFILSLINKNKSVISPQQIFDNMSICFAMDKSIKTNKWEYVKYL